MKKWDFPGIVDFWPKSRNILVHWTWVRQPYLEGNTEYTIGVQGVVSAADGDRYDTDTTHVTFTTAPVIENAEAEFIRSSSFGLSWKIEINPDQYRVIISPEIRGFFDGISELDQPGKLVIERAQPDRVRIIVSVIFFYT